MPPIQHYQLIRIVMGGLPINVRKQISHLHKTANIYEHLTRVWNQETNITYINYFLDNEEVII